MKRFLVAVIVIVSMFFIHQSGFCEGPVKVGVVDMQKFQQKSKSFQVLREKLKQKYISLQKKLEAEEQKLRKAEEDLKKQMMMLSLDAKTDKRNELERKKRHFKYVYEEYKHEMRNAQEEATRTVSMEVGKVVGKIGETQGYTLIIETRAIGLIYFDDAVDITDEVIRAYDEMKQ